MTTGVCDPVLRECAARADLDDTMLAAQFLAQQQIHAHRSLDRLRRWAHTALEAGQAHARESDGELSAQAHESGLTVVETTGGMRPGWVVVAEYHERRREIRLHRDVIDAAEQLVDQLGWRDWYPAGALRDAAVAHELGHRRLHGPAARELRAQLGLVTLRIGRFRRYGHVTGAPELYAHGYAQQACGLGRSPLLITNALAVAAGARTAKDDG
ncbi:MAG: hypothetical protein ACRDT8_12775 [Micromonosporaceae bacterium]